MEQGEPQRKRPHLENNDTLMARRSHSPPPDDDTRADATLLQEQNQMLVQQFDVQKQELHDLESKILDLQRKQMSYDEVLIKVNKMWNELIDDIVLFAAQVGASPSVFQCLDHAESSRGSIPLCSVEDIFLCRLLKLDSINDGSENTILLVKEALQLRHSSTMELVKLLEDTLHSQGTKFDELAQIFIEKLSKEDVCLQLRKINDLIKEEVNHLHEVMDVLSSKCNIYSDEIHVLIDNHSIDQLEIKRLSGELEETLMDLEESRRKLVNMKMQKDGAPGMHVPIPIPILPSSSNGTVSPEKPAEKLKCLRELKESIQETKALAEDRLAELQDYHEDNLVLSKQLQDLQNELNEDKYVYSSRPYSLLNDQLQHWTTESERHKSLAESLQAERPLILRREKDVILKSEAVDSSRTAISNSELRVEELQKLLHTCVSEKNEMERLMEETAQDLERRDIKEEFQVMASALLKEMGMMESQVKKWKDKADEATSLKEKAQSLNVLLDVKTTELRNSADDCAQLMDEVKRMTAVAEKMQKENKELEIFMDMVNKEMYSNRDLAAIKESERQAHAQAEALSKALDEHSLEFRVRAAHEAEAVCEHRLSVAEAEIAELRAQLDASDRDVLELTEAIKIKEGEAESYISEIETIGQAYEDMQTQNQHLLKQMTERNEYNIKLVSDSVKAKQSQNKLLLVKQGLENHLQQLNASLDTLKLRIAQNEEQMKLYLAEVPSCIQEEKHLTLKLEYAKWELADAEKELKMLKSAVSVSEKEHEQIQRKLDDIKKELENERVERKKLDEEVMEVNRTVDELTSETSEAAMQKLQDEIKDSKAILKCGVCSDRPKEVVIVKCFHLFCNQCIQRNLEIRHRRCPGCGTAFGQNDVRFVKI